MSHVMHGYFLENDSQINQEWVFTKIKDLFLNFNGVMITKEKDPFDDQESLNLNFGGYWLSVFYDHSQQVHNDFAFIQQSVANVSSRIRIVFGADNDNLFDDIAVIVYDFLLNLDHVLVYDVNQNEVVERHP